MVLLGIVGLPLIRSVLRNIVNT